MSRLYRSRSVGSDLASIFLAVLVIVATIGAAIGWGLNVWKLAVLVLHNPDLNVLLLGRALGIFVAPLGAILGYL